MPIPEMHDELPQPDENRDSDSEQDLESGELSLAELSEAYASVLKQNGQSSDGDADCEADGGRTGESPEPEDEDLHPAAEAAAAKPGKTKKQLTISELDAADNAPCPVSPKSIIESLLFVGSPNGVKLNAKKIAAVMRDVSPKEVKKTISEINREYEKQNSAFRIVEEKGHIKMQLCEDLVEVQNYFFGRNKAARLSQGAIDVLAVVAYNQPVTKARIEKIRTRPSGGVLGQLLRRNLIEFVEEDKPGKEKKYQTTDRFLKLFGLESLEDLPQTSVVSDLEELTDY